jgi:hypothetical protein
MYAENAKSLLDSMKSLKGFEMYARKKFISIEYNINRYEGERKNLHGLFGVVFIQHLGRVSSSFSFQCSMFFSFMLLDFSPSVLPIPHPIV